MGHVSAVLLWAFMTFLSAAGCLVMSGAGFSALMWTVAAIVMGAFWSPLAFLGAMAES